MKKSVSTVLLVLLLFSTSFSRGEAAPLSSQATQASITLLRSDENSVVIEFSMPRYELVDDHNLGKACLRLESAGLAQGGAPGTPELPVLGSLIGLPSTGEFEVTVASLESISLSSATPICPAPDAAAEEDAEGVQRYLEQEAQPDPTIYSQDAYYPERSAKVEEIGNLRGQRLARVEFSPFQINPVDGSVFVHSKIAVTVTFTGVDTTALAAATQGMPDAMRDQVLGPLVLNYETARDWSQRSLQAASVQAKPWRIPDPSWRIDVDTTGIIALSFNTLSQAGVPVDVVDPAHFRLFYEGEEMAIQVTGADDGSFDANDQILFYGVTTSERYARYNAYWLHVGSEIGKRMQISEGVEYGTMATSYRETVHSETNTSYVSALPMESGFDHWYGDSITAVGANGKGSLTIRKEVSELMSVDGTAQITVAVAGLVRGTHHLLVHVNGTQVLDTSWSDSNHRRFSTEFDAALLQNGDNNLTLTLLNDTPGQNLDIVYLDWVSLSYPRGFNALSGQLAFAATETGARQYAVNGLVHEEVGVYDVTDPLAVDRIRARTDGQTITFADDPNTLHHYHVATPNGWQEPVQVVRTQYDWLGAGAADYIMIAPDEFMDAIEPLAAYRAEQGYRVRRVAVQQIYDQFNGGRPAAEAIRDFLAYAYQSWAPPAPMFVLLVGDGNYDPRGYLASSSPTWVPPYLAMVDPDLGETATDNRFVTVDGDDLLPDMQIGRFPARNAEEVSAMVAKTIGYEARRDDKQWKKNVLFVADNVKSGGGDFPTYSDAIADGQAVTPAGMAPLLPDTFVKDKLYLGQQVERCPDESPASTCRSSIVEKINAGASIVSYVGHGAKQFWAGEQMFNLNALQQLDNRDRLPIMLPMTCLEGFFHDATEEAFAEEIVRLPENGAVASWSPTGFGLVTGHDYLEKGFFLAVFHYQFRDIGVAASYGKLYLKAYGPGSRYDDLLDTFLLIGDPALRLDLATLDDPEVLMPTEVFLPMISGP